MFIGGLLVRFIGRTSHAIFEEIINDDMFEIMKLYGLKKRSDYSKVLYMATRKIIILRIDWA